MHSPDSLARRSVLFAMMVVAAACGAGGGEHPDARRYDSSPGGGQDDGDGPPPGQVAPHPFGTHGGYVTAGVIFPSNHSQAELDAQTAAFYDQWKARYLV